MVILLTVLGVLGLGAAAGHSALDYLPQCDADPATNYPCVVEVKKDGVAFPYFDDDGPSEHAWAYKYSRDGAKWFNFNIWAPPPVAPEPWPFTLDPADSYSITINTGNVVPAETFARGNDVKVDRSVNATGQHIVTFVQHPVRMSDDSCDGAGVCSHTARRTLPGAVDGTIDNLGYIDDPADAASMRGFDLASNIDWVGSPPELDYLTNSIFLRVHNAHFEQDGATVFKGLAEFKLPFPMLRRLYQVDDPAHLVASAFTVTGAGGADVISVTVDPGGETIRVDIDGITFSKKRLRITGDMRPTRPRNVEAVRVTPTKGRIRFDPAQSRGSRVRDYKAYCRDTADNSNFYSWRVNDESPLVLRGLQPGLRYECTVRARSRAGSSRAARVTMPRFPG